MSYYSPEISEFHIGFEYIEFAMDTERYLNKGVIAHEMVYGPNSPRLHHIEKAIQRKQIACKHLDQEDIENLGFREVNRDLAGVYNIKSVDGKELRLWKTTNGEVVVVETVEMNLFQGIIKNKSELKTVLKMIGYEH